MQRLEEHIGKRNMGLRFRKSIKIAPGIRLNLSKTGTSMSVGKPGLSVNLGRNGLTGNVGIPGTGLSYRKKIGGGSVPTQGNPPIPQGQQIQVTNGPDAVWKWLFFAAIFVIIVLLVAMG